VMRRHPGRPKHDVLSVVEFPVAGEDAALPLVARMQRRARERREDGEARKIDGRVDRELDRLLERLRSVVVVAEHETPLQADAEGMEVADELSIERGIVEALADVAQAGVVDGLQADQEAAAAPPGPSAPHVPL